VLQRLEARLADELDVGAAVFAVGVPETWGGHTGRSDIVLCGPGLVPKRVLIGIDSTSAVRVSDGSFGASMANLRISRPRHSIREGRRDLPSLARAPRLIWDRCSASSHVRIDLK